MPVRNPNRSGPRRPVINQEPTTARGKRRSKETDEYKANVEARKAQSSPAGSKGSGGQKKPQKGPSHRPKGTSNDRWRAYMEGRSATL